MKRIHELSFYKLDGAGNDFVGVDWRETPVPPAEELAQIVRLLCNRYHGVGADGIIMLLSTNSPDRYHFAMKYYNADGSHGEMCGNGARCAAVFAHFRGAAPEKMKFLTDAGDYEAELRPGGSSVHFPDVTKLPERRKMEGPLRTVESVEFLRVGVPHAIAFVEDLDLFDVQTAGREVRFDPALRPAGANANFGEYKDGVIHVRTYERGVEGETQACGSGSVATACCFAEARKLEGPQRLHVKPTSGASLFIGFERTGAGFRNVTLEGPARIVFRGECRVNLERGEVSVL